ncbi:MAG TPA: xanthine dehydrogenase family protein molybdopterin-binding subunit [Thermoleophilaceae bacterium]
MTSEVGSPAGGRLVGRPLPRREDARVLGGHSEFLDDLHPAGLAHLAFVRSPYAHARVLSVTPPRGAPGLLAVLTARELEGRTRPLPIQSPEGSEVADEPHPLLAAGEVRYVGQPVAAVVAESRALAEDAAELVGVEYEELDPVADPHASDLELLRWRRTAGDVEGAFRSAARVAGGRYAMPRLVAAPMEARGALAYHDPAADLLTVWCSAQDTHRPLRHLGHVLGRPAEQLRVVVPDVGGAFGSKGSLAPEAAVAAIAAIDVGRPVKWAEDRAENFVAAYQGRGMEAEVELALAADGRMLAVRARILADLGAYLLPATAMPPHTAAMLMAGCYTIPAADVRVSGVRTNKVPTGPYRGAGRPEAAYFLERAVDDAARALALDPVELRRRNLIREFPHRSPLGWTYDSGDYRRCLDLALDLAGPRRAHSDEGLVGRGVAMYVERAGGSFEAARATLEPDGRVIVRSSTSPHGQGHDMTFAQIAAERLHVDPGDVVLEFGDSALVPGGTGTFASRSVAMGGSAVARAVDELGKQCVQTAARLLDAPEDEITWGEEGLAAGDGRTLALPDVAAAGPLEATARFESDLVFGSGAYAAEVEIERATGRLTVRRLTAVDDAGTIVNPLLAEGQVLGGAVQGLGECLAEEATYDDQAQPTSASFADYSLLTAAEIPPIAAEFVESPSPLNPLGAKGIGEAGAIGTPAAVANAVSDALGGRHVDPPFTEEKLWRAIGE